MYDSTTTVVLILIEVLSLPHEHMSGYACFSGRCLGKCLVMQNSQYNRMIQVAHSTYILVFIAHRAIDRNMALLSSWHAVSQSSTTALRGSHVSSQSVHDCCNTTTTYRCTINNVFERDNGIRPASRLSPGGTIDITIVSYDYHISHDHASHTVVQYYNSIIVLTVPSLYNYCCTTTVRRSTIKYNI